MVSRKRDSAADGRCTHPPIWTFIPAWTRAGRDC
jgi:hypothetical protein